MTTSSDSLRTISAQGATLWERLAHRGEGEPPAPEALVEILKPWAKACAQGDVERLFRRMSWEGVDPMSAAHSLVEAERLAEAEQVDSVAWQALPDVVLEAQSVLSRLKDVGPSLRDGSSGPFPELWQPWVTVASRQLEHLELDLSVFTDVAVQSLLELFRTDVARLSESAAYRSFLDLREIRDGAESREGVLDDFLQVCLADLAGTLYTSYPVLARQLDRSLGQWLNQVNELAERFASDRSSLAETGLIAEGSVRIDAVEGGVGDRHNDGRQVLLLQLSDGRRLVYKPRSLRPEGLFEEVASWCAARGLRNGPAGARCLDRGTYGWMEWVDSERLETEEEAREYYRRAGSLVAVAYVLRAEDLHGENLIATRRGPIVIDGEIVMQPARASVSTGEAGIDSENTVRQGSCLASAMLTQLLPGGREDRSFGGLRWPRVRRRKIRTWQNLHTDDLEFQEGVLEEGPRGNVLHVGEERAPIGSFGDELIQGFRATYEFFEANAEDFEAFLRTSFLDLPVRVLLRATGDYGQVVMLNSLARNQKSGLSGSFLNEAMVTPLTAAEERPRQWPILVDERRSLERGDIPWFAMRADSTHLVSSAGEEIFGLFRSSGLDEVGARLQALGAADLEWQLTLLERALNEPPAPFFVGRLPVVTSAAATDDDPAAWNEYRASCLRSAVAIGEQVSSGLKRAWTPSTDGTTEVALRPEVDWSIATGRLGTSLFAAAMAQGIPEYGDLAHAGVAPLLGDLGPKEWAAVLSRGEETSLGVHSGAGSIVWSLVWLSRLLGEPRALEAAAGAASQMVESSNLPDVLSRRDAVALDLEGGAAGAVLALLAVAQETGQGRWIEHAVELGDRILASQQPHGSLGASWVNRGGLMQPGWAHGAAGIARAMDALAGASGQSRFHLSALSAVSWERSIYDGRRKNWPATTLDQWERRDSVYLSTVCRGAPGVGLSRLMIGPQLSDAMITAEIEVALDHAAIPELGQLDNLCCGAMGRSSVLLSAALAGHGDAEARRKQAFDLANAVLARANRDGFFRVSGDLYSCYAEDLRFHYGWTGIGYHLLRLAGAEMLPDVLAAELPSEASGRGQDG